MLTPGWHDVSIKYGNSPRLGGGSPSSVLRLFVIDAAQVRDATGREQARGVRVSVKTNHVSSLHLTSAHLPSLSEHPFRDAQVNSVDIDGIPSYEIVWQGQGRCCTSSAAALAAAAEAGPTCLAPLDCCRFRTAEPCADGAGPAATTPARPAKKTTPSKTHQKVTPAPTATPTSPPPAAEGPTAPAPPPPSTPAGTAAPAPRTANLNETVPIPVKGTTRNSRTPGQRREVWVE